MSVDQQDRKFRWSSSGSYAEKIGKVPIDSPPDSNQKQMMDSFKTEIEEDDIKEELEISTASIPKTAPWQIDLTCTDGGRVRYDSGSISHSREEKAEVLDYAGKHGISDTAEHFEIPKSTLYKWRQLEQGIKSIVSEMEAICYMGLKSEKLDSIFEGN